MPGFKDATTLWSRMRARFTDRDAFRGWAIDANDGIIATAGLLLGFAGAGAGDRLLLFAATAAMLAGGLSAGGATWAEVAAEREAQLSLVSYEQEQLAWNPDAERAVLIDYWTTRGLEPALAAQVADQLRAHDPVAAQLDAEYGLEEVLSQAAPWWAGLETSVAFMIGAAIPVLITFFAPVDVETWAVVSAVVASLILTSMVFGKIGRLSGLRMLIRSLVVGLGTMGVSYLAGTVLL